MSNLGTSASLYARVALLRRSALLRQSTAHALLAGVAIIMLMVGFALLNVIVFLALRPSLGDIGATAVVCVAHFAAGGIALAFALGEPRSRELDALAQAEQAAFSAVSAEAGAIMGAVRSLETKLEGVGAGLALGVDAMSALGTLLKAADTNAPRLAASDIMQRKSGANSGGGANQ